MQECAALDASRPKSHHGYLVVGLAALLVREVAGFMAAFAEHRSSPSSSGFVFSACAAPALLCLIIMTLMVYEAIFTFSAEPWAHVGSLGRPVYTLRYAEWMITVPALLLLTGGCALGRPLKDLAMPIVVTEVYMAIAWLALLLSNPILRWVLILITFLGYGLASYGMMNWIGAYLGLAARDATCKWLRISSVLMLILLFAIYGVIYLQALGHVISPHVEEISYTMFGFGCKVVMSMIFTAIRIMEYHSELNGLLCRISGVSTAFMSLLRSNFDFVVPCVADPGGRCHLPSAHSGDSRNLEHALGRPVLGASVNELLAGASERRRFAAYVQNVWRQVSKQPHGKASCQMSWDDGDQSQIPPMAQVLHVKLDQSADQTPLHAVVHLSLVPQSGKLVGLQQRMILGFRLVSDEPVLKHKSKKKAKIEGPQDIPTPTSFTTGGSTQCPSPEAALGPLGPSAASDSSSVKAPSQKDSKVTPAKVRLAKQMERRIKKTAAKKPNKDKKAKKVEGMKGVKGETLEEGKVAGDMFKGGWEAKSQSSKLSAPGSVVRACQKLLGPLHEGLPPAQLTSKRIEDHMQIAAEHVRLKAAAKIARLHNQQEVEDWEDQKEGHLLSKMLQMSNAPANGIQEEVWRQHMMPNLVEQDPGTRPEEVAEPHDAELWYKAWQKTYDPDSSEDSESDESGSEDSESDSSDEEDTAEVDRIRSDPRMQQVVAQMDATRDSPRSSSQSDR